MGDSLSYIDNLFLNLNALCSLIFVDDNYTDKINLSYLKVFPKEKF